MDKKTKSRIVELFETALSAEHPTFKLLSVAELKKNAIKDVHPGCRLFAYQAASEFWLFIYLKTSPKAGEDCFTVELGWCRDGIYPWTPLGPFDEPLEYERSFRLPALWRGQNDPWWWVTSPGSSSQTEVAPEVEHDVPSQVADAVARLKKYGIPYFEKVAVHNGVRLSLK